MGGDSGWGVDLLLIHKIFSLIHNLIHKIIIVYYIESSEHEI